MQVSDFFDDLVEKQGVYIPSGACDGQEISYPDSGYDELLTIEENSFWFTHRNYCIETLIRKFSPSAVLFDIGAGSGAVSAYLQKQNLQSIVIEPGLQGAVNCVSRGLTAIAARFEDLKKNHKRSIEAVALFDVLEHIQDDEDFLIKLRSFMDKDASLYITVPAYMFLWSSEDDYAQHHRRYTLGALVSLLRRAGFSISYASYFFLPLVLPIFLFRVLPSRLGWRENSLERNKQEHSGGGLLEKILRVSLAFERYILKFLRLPCGASLMVVAKPTLPR